MKLLPIIFPNSFSLKQFQLHPTRSRLCFQYLAPSRFACMHKRCGREVNKIQEEKTRSWTFYLFPLSVCIADLLTVCKILVARINVCEPIKIVFHSVFFVLCAALLTLSAVSKKKTAAR